MSKSELWSKTGPDVLSPAILGLSHTKDRYKYWRNYPPYYVLID